MTNQTVRATTTIRIDVGTHERLAILAAERGMSLKDFVDSLASGIPTRTELHARTAAAADYLREHIGVDLTDEDLTAGETFWQDLAAGRTPEDL